MRPIDDTQNLQRSAIDRTNVTPPNRKNETEKPDNKPLTAPNSDAAISNHKFYGQRQKERLNAELIAYSVGGNSAFRDVRLAKTTKNANTAYQETFDKDFKKFADYTIKIKSGESVADYNGAKTYHETFSQNYR